MTCQARQPLFLWQLPSATSPLAQLVSKLRQLPCCSSGQRRGGRGWRPSWPHPTPPHATGSQLQLPAKGLPLWPPGALVPFVLLSSGRGAGGPRRPEAGGAGLGCSRGLGWQWGPPPREGLSGSEGTRKAGRNGWPAPVQRWSTLRTSRLRDWARLSCPQAPGPHPCLSGPHGDPDPGRGYPSSCLRPCVCTHTHTHSRAHPTHSHTHNHVHSHTPPHALEQGGPPSESEPRPFTNPV